MWFSHESLESDMTPSTLFVVPTVISLKVTLILRASWACFEKYVAYVMWTEYLIVLMARRIIFYFGRYFRVPEKFSIDKRSC